MMVAVVFKIKNVIFKYDKAEKLATKEAFKQVTKTLKISPKILESEFKNLEKSIRNDRNVNKHTFSYKLKTILKNKELKFDSKFVKQIANFHEDTLIKNLEFTRGSRKYFNLQSYPQYQTISTELPRKLTMRILEHFQIKDVFQTIITSDEVGRLKPHANYFELLWQKLDMMPDQGFYVSDNWEIDCAPAQELGGVGIIFGHDDPNAIFSIKNMMELVDLVRRRSL